jgi:hypothetical protein
MDDHPQCAHAIWMYEPQINYFPSRRFGDRIDCVSDFEVEMVQVCPSDYFVVHGPSRSISRPITPANHQYHLSVEFPFDPLICSVRAKVFI